MSVDDSSELYQAAASVLRDFDNAKGTVKGLVLAYDDYGNKKKLYAVTMETAKRMSQIYDAIRKAGAESESIFSDDQYLALVIAREVLFSRQILSLRNRSEMAGFINKLKSVRAAVQEANVKPSAQPYPRFARVNLLKTTVAEVCDELVAEGFHQQEVPDVTYEEFLARVAALGEYEFMIDFHIDSILVFSARYRDLYAHEAVRSARLIIQDKASCLPALILNPPRDASIIDACCAPGNKTSHLSAIMANTGVIHAIDRDASRIKLMRRFLQQRGVKNVRVSCGDFMRIDEEAYGSATHILLDPSCSCSGMKDLEATEGQRKFDSSRVRKLANFQSMMLKHALRAPKAVRVVYSTCSLHVEENERVVAEALYWKIPEGLEFADWKLKRPMPGISAHEGIRLTDKQLPKGASLKDAKSLAKRCIRLSASDLTGSFFVACFERKLTEASPADATYESKVVQDIGNGEAADFEMREDDDVSQKRRKKKKRRRDSAAVEDEIAEVEEVSIVEETEKLTKKKKKRKAEEEEQVATPIETDPPKKKKRKKRKASDDDEEV